MYKDIPTKLYKYVPPERISILINLKVRFTPVEEFNDPFELWPRFEKPDRELIYPWWKKWREKSRDSSKGWTALVPNLEAEEKEFEEYYNTFDHTGFSKHAHEGPRNKFGIFSLTSNPQNLIMWAHYAKGHEGFLIEFDALKLEESLGTIFPMFYSKTLERVPSKVGSANHSLHMFFMLAKSNEWEKEKEYRLFKYDEIDKCPLQLYPITADCITGITLGVRMNSRWKKEI